MCSDKQELLFLRHQRMLQSFCIHNGQCIVPCLPSIISLSFTTSSLHLVMYVRGRGKGGKKQLRDCTALKIEYPKIMAISF